MWRESILSLCGCLVCHQARQREPLSAESSCWPHIFLMYSSTLDDTFISEKNNSTIPLGKYQLRKDLLKFLTEVKLQINVWFKISFYKSLTKLKLWINFCSKFPSVKTKQTTPLLSRLDLSVLFSFTLKWCFSLCPAEQEMWRVAPGKRLQALPYLGFVQPKEHAQKNSCYMNLGDAFPTLITHKRSLQILTHHSRTPTSPLWILTHLQHSCVQ